jgi:hypothetical protein
MEEHYGTYVLPDTLKFVKLRHTRKIYIVLETVNKPEQFVVMDYDGRIRTPDLDAPTRGKLWKNVPVNTVVDLVWNEKALWDGSGILGRSYHIFSSGHADGTYIDPLTGIHYMLENRTRSVVELDEFRGMVQVNKEGYVIHTTKLSNMRYHCEPQQGWVEKDNPIVRRFVYVG